MRRRSLITATFGLGGFAGMFGVLPAQAAEPALRGAIAPDLRSDPAEDQTLLLQALLEEAAAEDRALYLPAGSFRVSSLRLPRRTRIVGIRGATRLVHAGGPGPVLEAQDADRLLLSGITFDGARMPLVGERPALLAIRGGSDVALEDCAFVDSSANGLWLEAVSGHVERCTVDRVAGVGLYALDSRGLRLAANRISDCGDGGILVHRSSVADDGTLISSNRVERIDAASGGTGQWGNGINIFRGGNVAVVDNHIEDCAFSAIRANSAGNIRISSNTCLRSGETAIYSEFAFEGAAVSSNVVDGAAHGINVVNFNEGGRLATVTGNIVRNLKPDAPYPPELLGFGVGISVEADTVVSGNVIENAPVCGISIGWGEFMRHVVASGNIVRNASKGIIVTVVEGTGPAIIANNILSGTAEGAIVAHRWTEPASGDLAREGSDGFPRLTVSGNAAS